MVKPLVLNFTIYLFYYALHLTYYILVDSPREVVTLREADRGRGVREVVRGFRSTEFVGIPVDSPWRSFHP